MKPTDANRPLRVLDRVLGGGLGAGNLGVVMARHGSGKVAVLTCMAIDHAMDGTETLHVAIGKTVTAVRAYDDEVLSQICNRYEVGDRASIMTSVERHKQIYTFRDAESFTRERFRAALDMLRDHAEFEPEFIEVQGWPDWRTLTEDEVVALRKIAEDYKCEIWLTAHTYRDDTVDADGVPDWLAKSKEHLSVIMALEPQAGETPIRFVKVHDQPVQKGIHLEFDPESMMIRWR